MEEFKGIVKAIKQRDKTYSIRVQDKWYSGFDLCPVNKGDKVKITYKVNGNFNNIDIIEKIDAEIIEKAKIPIDRSEEIRRQVFIKIGAEIVKHQNIDDWPIEDITKQIFLIAKSMKKEWDKW